MKKLSILSAGLLSFFAFQATSAQTVSYPQCHTLKCVRNQIDQVDNSLLHLFAIRAHWVKEAGVIKKQNGIKTAYDGARIRAILNSIAAEGQRSYQLPTRYTKQIFSCILNTSTNFEQTAVFHNKKS